MSTVKTPTSANLIRSLINAAEKASNIARICRAHDELLSLLVQEKVGEEANARFEHDFKTLADVLIQETIKHDVGKLFPSLCARIKGEESPIFTNTLGDTVSIAVGVDAAETAKCLAAVLSGHPSAADVLAGEVHRAVNYTSSDLSEIPELPADLNYDNLGIWIDPIDATAEYISGNTIPSTQPGIASAGLECVTVLIGVYDCISGEPIIGVISQPFHNKLGENAYESAIYWGVCLPNLKANNCHAAQPTCSPPSGIFSTSEKAALLQFVQEMGYALVFSAGAGHKALKIITSEADLYLLSKGSTFKWDTCAPQAILRSLGGNIFDFNESLWQKTAIPLSYLEVAGEDNKANKGGLIAVKDSAKIQNLLQQQKILEIC